MNSINSKMFWINHKFNIESLKINLIQSKIFQIQKLI